MNMILDQMNELDKKIAEDNLFVNKIIVNKNKSEKQVFPFIATVRWINQLGNRLQINS